MQGRRCARQFSVGKRGACPTIWRVISEFDRAERDVEQQSASLKKPLALRDLVLTQILFVVGSSWVGAAAKLGQAHLFFWLLAILLFYVPQAAVVIYLSRVMWPVSTIASAPSLFAFAIARRTDSTGY